MCEPPIVPGGAADPQAIGGLDWRALGRSPRAGAPGRGRRLARPEQEKTPAYNPQQRLMILDCWQRSGLPADDFAPLVGISKHTLYAWKKRFADQGPAGLMEPPRGARKGSHLPELTRRKIVDSWALNSRMVK
jgi:hypothetical protein